MWNSNLTHFNSTDKLDINWDNQRLSYVISKNGIKMLYEAVLVVDMNLSDCLPQSIKLSFIG